MDGPRQRAAAGEQVLKVSTKAVITAEAVSDTRSKKHTPATIAKDRKRARRKLAKLLPGLGLTPQIVFNASCGWPNTLPAPKSATAFRSRLRSDPPQACPHSRRCP